jgi:hypothetical protein
MKKIIILSLFLAIAGCVTISYPTVFQEILQAAGDNSLELKKAINYFQNKGNFLELSSLYFLLENIEGHHYFEFGLFDAQNNQIEWHIEDYASYQKAKAAMDSLENQYGKLHWDKAKKIEDVQAISSQYLINNVELAYQAWKNKPWAQQFPYQSFQEYILPYRVNNEPIGNWRQFFLKEYQDLPQKLENPEDMIEAATYINEKLKSWVKFDSKYYLHPTDQSFMQMLRSGKGRCEDMSTFAIYAMRANGICVAADYTPYWADSNNNHVWNALITLDGKTIPFMGCEVNPGEYELAHKVAKVYRKSFRKQQQNLAFQQNNADRIPPWLGSKFSRDVTPFYTKVNDIVVKLDTLKYPQPENSRFLFLAVFNNGAWRPIDWAKIEQNSAEFIDMGLEIMYLPCYYNRKVIPAGPPFILQKNGKQYVLDGKKAKNLSITFTAVDKAKFTSPSDSLYFEGEEGKYELFFWHKKWISLGKKTTTGQALHFSNIPANRIYRLTKTNDIGNERIFSFKNEKQIWW